MPWEPLPHEAELFSEVYIDETSQNSHHYLVLGGIIVPRKYADQFSAAVLNARGADLPAVAANGEPSEIKWAKVSNKKLAAYKRVVNAFFAFANTMPISTGHLNFHSTVVDLTAKDGRLTELGFSKELYQLCLKFARQYPRALLHVYLDQRSTTESISEQKNIFNHGAHKLYHRKDWPFRRLHFRDSRDLQGLQVADILLGAIAFRLNGHYAAPNASPARKELCDFVLRLARVTDVFRDTRHAGRFTIWHRDKPWLKPKLKASRSPTPLQVVPAKGTSSP
jgi:uncharacterized protein DUF3800